MHYFTERTDPELVPLLQNGAIGVLKTDTLYGIVASAHHQAAVERVFSVRERDRDKACIILIASEEDLFDAPQPILAEFMTSHWPGPVSIAIASPSAPEYLRFRDGTVAYRLPADEELRDLLMQTGPLIAPSANLQGHPPAKNIAEAEAYFGSSVDFYVDSGEVENTSPSQLWVFANNKMERVR